jgi:hypothetical protein
VSQVEIAVGFYNEGAEPFNITLITGSLNSPLDFSMFIQNFTQMVRPSCGHSGPDHLDLAVLSIIVLLSGRSP